MQSIARMSRTGATILIWAGALVLLSVSLGHAQTSAAVRPAGDAVVFTAEQGVGGTHLTLPDGARAVTIDRTCTPPSVDWKLPEPMPAGWWHGTVELGKREKEDMGWAQVTFGVFLLTPDVPMVNLRDNFQVPAATGQTQFSVPGPFSFTFWIYSAFPAQGISIRPVYSQIWKLKRLWPVTRVTMERAAAPSFTANEPIVLDVPVQADGTVALPDGLPAGSWYLAFSSKCEGEAVCSGTDGRDVHAPFTTKFVGSLGGWRGGVYAWLDAPFQKMVLKGTLPKSLALNNLVIRPATNALPSTYALMTTVDPARTETGRLELTGHDLTGDAPAVPLLPLGRRIAVVTSWDDGPESDLRMAAILKRLGMRGSFMFNANNPGLATLDKLEALGMEVGSHGYNHSDLFLLPPPRALDECAAMRELLEHKLGHPVISFAYPDGYSKACDVEGDYVLRALRTAGYWAGRTTLGGREPVGAIAEPLALKTSGVMGADKSGLVREWEAVRATTGAVFYVWGHTARLGQTDAQWQNVEETLATFAGKPDAWYASQGDLSVWCWLREHAKLTVNERSPTRVVVSVSRPWLHPYLAARRSLCLRLPAGVERVTWQDRDVAATNGFVELPWAEGVQASASKR